MFEHTEANKLYRGIITSEILTNSQSITTSEILTNSQNITTPQILTNSHSSLTKFFQVSAWEKKLVHKNKLLLYDNIQEYYTPRIVNVIRIMSGIINSYKSITRKQSIINNWQQLSTCYPELPVDEICHSTIRSCTSLHRSADHSLPPQEAAVFVQNWWRPAQEWFGSPSNPRRRISLGSTRRCRTVGRASRTGRWCGNGVGPDARPWEWIPENWLRQTPGSVW